MHSAQLTMCGRYVATSDNTYASGISCRQQDAVYMCYLAPRCYEGACCRVTELFRRPRRVRKVLAERPEPPPRRPGPLT